MQKQSGAIPLAVACSFLCTLQLIFSLPFATITCDEAAAAALMICTEVNNI